MGFGPLSAVAAAAQGCLEVTQLGRTDEGIGLRKTAPQSLLP